MITTPELAENITSAVARLTPRRHMQTLSQLEVKQLSQGDSDDDAYEIYRRCSLAVLNVGSQTDNARDVLEQNRNFDIRVIQQARGIKLELINAPHSAFVDGEIITGIQEQLFSVLRDISYIKNKIITNPIYDTEGPEGITNLVFHILRNARVLTPEVEPDLVVCWGGHSIGREEYEYTKEVGYQLGLRAFNICTGCGPGAMKGPMKGAAIGHSKQRIYRGKFLGLTEPGIIAAEPPNPIVNELVILPDIEKRLEAFVRTGHGIIVFPGGVGTMEEILYVLGILMHPDNKQIPFPLILTGPRSARDYFNNIDQFIRLTLGEEATKHYRIIVDDPETVAREMHAGLDAVEAFRREYSDAFYFNWLLQIEQQFQQPFVTTHENVADLEISHDIPAHELAANLRRLFSAIVCGNIKVEGIQMIEEHGPFQINGEKQIMKAVDWLLKSFVAQHRMKMPGHHYHPCYEIIR